VLDLLLFTTDTSLARRAISAGAAGIVIDWERRGKEERQAGFDTLVAQDNPEDLERMRASVSAPLICRVDPLGPGSAEQIELAIEMGADELLLPMIRSPADVEGVLELVDGRCGVGFMLETIDALACADELASLPVSRVYVGLNDLAIERGSQSLFSALADGTVEAVRESFSNIPFGFAGPGVPDSAATVNFPVAPALLLGELARLRADFTTLRRSFWRYVEGRDVALALATFASAAKAAASRDERAVARDHAALVAAVEAWVPGPRQLAGDV
jgi:hypothetical protein